MDANVVILCSSAAGAFVGSLLSKARTPNPKQITEMIGQAVAKALDEHAAHCSLRATLYPPAVTPAYGFPLPPKKG